MEIIRGINAVNHLLDGKKRKVDEVLVDERNADKILSKLNNTKLPIRKVKKDLLDRLSDYTSHQGVVARVSNYQYKDINSISNENLIIMCDHVEDPHNLGAIIRTAEALGVKTVIINSDRAAQINDTVVKTSAGTTEIIDVCKVSNTARALKQLKNAGFWVVGTSLDTDLSYGDVNYDGKYVIVVGNEGKGIAKNVQKECDILVKIPMEGSTNSLNVSVATALMLAKVKGM